MLAVKEYSRIQEIRLPRKGMLCRETTLRVAPEMILRPPALLESPPSGLRQEEGVK